MNFTVTEKVIVPWYQNKNVTNCLRHNILILHPFLEEQYYSLLIKSIPDIKYYQPKYMNLEEEHITGQERYHLWLKPSVAKFPNMNKWNFLINELCSHQFIRTILEQFKISDFSTINLNEYQTSVRLVKEKYRSFLETHVDRGEKFLTMILYLSEEQIRAPYGTSIYKQHSGELKEEISVFYYPNTALFLLHPNKTYHGVNDFKLKQDRNTLQFFLSKEMNVYI